MKTPMDIVFYHSFFLSLLIGGLAFMTYRKTKSGEFMNLAEFWCSLAVMSLISYIFRVGDESTLALALLGWLWPLKTIIQITQDMAPAQRFETRPKIIVMAIGSFLTLAMVSFENDFRYFTAPFCLATGIVGIMLLLDLYRGVNRRSFSLLGHTTFALLGLFFTVRFFYPLWRATEYEMIGLSVHFFTFLSLGVTTYAFYMENFKSKQEQQLQALVNERNEKLLGQSKYSELGMMSAGIAHEINNPLAIIQAKTTQLLRIHHDYNRIHEVTEGLEQILYTSERINRTIQGVREFVHQDERLPVQEFSLKSLVDDVLAFCGQRMKNHGVNLRFYGLENFTLQGHKIQLEQVLLNLLNNSFDAIEYLPDKWIELSVRESEHTLQIFFKDSGCGIPPEVAARIMEPFYTTKNIGKGTGLGLALARGIIEKHGGALVYVGEARHTTFMLELPKNALSKRPVHVGHKQMRPDQNPIHWPAVT